MVWPASDFVLCRLIRISGSLSSHQEKAFDLPPRTPVHAAKTSAQYAARVGVPRRGNGFKARYFVDTERTSDFSIGFLEPQLVLTE
jgi:hypothetical protein